MTREEDEKLRELFFPHTRIYDYDVNKGDRQALYFMERTGKVRSGNETIYIPTIDREYRMFFWELNLQKEKEPEMVISEEDEVYSEHLWKTIDEYRSMKHEERTTS